MLLPTIGLLFLLSAAANAKRRLILDATQDNPSVTALLMALELSSAPNSDVEFLGAITTDSGELAQLQQVLESAGLTECMPPILAVDETELYPVYGTVIEELPKTVQFLVDKVQEYPSEVVLYSSGSLATFSMASQVEESFDSKLAELVVVANIHDSDTKFANDGKVDFHADSPMIRDQEAFMYLLHSEVSRIRVVAPQKPVLTDRSVADRVRAAVEAEGGNPYDRPLTRIYLTTHLRRSLQGIEQAILMQEPGAAMLLDPSLILAEDTFGFGFEPTLHALKVSTSGLEGEQATLIHAIDEQRSIDLLVKVRSKDWSAWCKERRVAADKQGHDEL